MLDSLSHANELFMICLVFPSIVLLGVYLTFRLRFVQISKLKMSFSYLFKKSEGGVGDITHYQAVASVLAGSFGTGNISGMAVALTTGGPGALIWMWVMAFFGAVIQYANCLLGVKYRQKNEQGEYVGGPMYYLSKGLKLKRTSILFSLVVILTAFCGGNFAQVNSMTLPLTALGISPWISGGVIAFFVALVVLGGAQRVAKVSSAVVPIMAFLYLGTAFVILGIYWEGLLPAISVLFRSAFSFSSFAGGIFGFTVLKALTSGFDRAIFATDAGTGSVPMLQAGAKTTNPVIDGVVALVAPLLVMIVCSATALILIVTGAFGESGLLSTNMVTFAFEKGVGKVGGLSIVIIALLLFGYTTTLAWAACLQRAVEYLFGRAWVRPFLLLYILLVPIGAILHVNFVWLLADFSLTAMMILNFIGVAGLSKEVIDDSRAYFGPATEERAL